MGKTYRCPHCGWLWQYDKPIALPAGDPRYLHCPHCKKQRGFNQYQGENRLELVDAILKSIPKEWTISKVMETIIEIAAKQTRPDIGNARFSVHGIHKGILGYKCDYSWNTSFEHAKGYHVQGINLRSSSFGNGFLTSIMQMEKYLENMDTSARVIPLIVLGGQLIDDKERSTIEWIEQIIYKTKEGKYSLMEDMI